MPQASVLVVDDDPVFRRAVTRFLQEFCGDQVAVVAAAAGGQEGLAKAHALQPDIVLLDLVLPDLHGLEVIPLLQKAVPHARIIAMTQYRVDGYRQASLEAGADEFVYKAVLKSALPIAIRRVRGEAQVQENG